MEAQIWYDSELCNELSLGDIYALLDFYKIPYSWARHRKGACPPQVELKGVTYDGYAELEQNIDLIVAIAEEAAVNA
jgi:hypothetical protein